MALKKVKGNLERMFDKNLTDLVRGIRNNKENEAKYIAQCMEDIKQELRQDNLNVKCNAVAKLTYLQMLGYDISWAGFNVIEVMSSNKFTMKRTGYLSASQSFHCDSELLMLTTNMIRKELNSQNQYDAGLALTSLSCYISSDLARDLSQDILTLLSSTKPYIRKKAVLMMYKVFLKYPDALRLAFPKLKEKLEDPDPGVQSAAVNVICELARKNPKNYLSLAPVFFKLMTTSTNNWMLIKIIKLFGALTPLEPRLGKKLIEPLTNLIHSTSAMSLLYECINTVIAVLISISSGMPNHAASIQLCVQKLRILIEDSDQNLKYLGLLAMSKILKTHPKSVQAHKDLVLQCLEDKDESIRLRALDLLYGMVSKKNLMEIVKKLMLHMDKAEGTVYRDELLTKIIQICAQNNYQFITNFEWYITVLVELSQMEFSSKQGQVISEQLMDVCIRVQAIRQFAVSEMSQLLELYTSSSQFTLMQDVLLAAAYLCGEFATDLDCPIDTLRVLLKYRTLPTNIEVVFLQNILKTFAKVLHQKTMQQKYDDELFELIDTIIAKYEDRMSRSHEEEVQERAANGIAILRIAKEYYTELKEADVKPLIDDEELDPLKKEEVAANDPFAEQFLLLFTGELNPVAPKAQKKVPIPDNLDLDSFLEEPELEHSSSDSEYDLEERNIFVKPERIEKEKIEKRKEYTPEELKSMRETRLNEQMHNPHYLKSSNKTTNTYKNGTHLSNVDEIPIEALDLPVKLKVIRKKRSDKYVYEEKEKNKAAKRKKRGKKSKRESSSDENERETSNYLVINKGLELPEGATLSDSENSVVNLDDPHRALDIDLEFPDDKPEVAKHKDSKKVKKVKKKDKKDKDEKKAKREKKGKREKPPEVVVEDLLGHSIIGDNIENEEITQSITTEVEAKIKEKKHHRKEKEKRTKRDKDGKIDKSDKKERKEKKSKEHKEGKLKKSKDKESSHHKHLQLQQNSEYEEAVGISTPSKEFV